MRVLLTPSGSRGDFQPLLAVAVALKAAGHHVVIATAGTFQSECDAFGIPFLPAGMDIRALVEQAGREGKLSPLRAALLLAEKGREHVRGFIDDLVRVGGGFDVMVGGGAQPAAPTAADALRVPYYFIAYTPQIFPSEHHPPFTIPLRGLPRWMNRLLWRLSNWMLWQAFGQRVQASRKQLGLPPVKDLVEYAFPRNRVLLACEPEITPLPPDVQLPHAPIGSLALADERPLPKDLVAFLQAGPPPVYIGFGSMTDVDPEGTTRMLVDAVKLAGCRAIISSGWAGFGGVPVPDNVMVVGPVSHALLMPRVAAAVHHGGAGTTAAVARAGKPQLVVPFMLDQVEFAARVYAAGLGPEPLPRQKLTAPRLAERIRTLLGEPSYARNAERVGQAMSARNAAASVVRILETELAAPRAGG